MAGREPERNPVVQAKAQANIKFLANEKIELVPEDVSLAAFHLSQFIRGQERLGAVR